jgi:hypothetical protein
MAKKQHNKQSSKKSKDDICRVTDRMPEWMREFLADKGIEGEFNLSKLSKWQCLALDFAEGLCQQEMKGLITVTYDPQRHSEPQAELTEQARNSHLERQVNLDGEDSNSTSQETLP